MIVNNGDNNFRLLDKKECLGKNRLDIFKNNYIDGGLSDFALIQCGSCLDTNESNNIGYWTSTLKNKKKVYSVLNSKEHINNVDDCNVGTRVCVSLDFIYESNFEKKFIFNEDGANYVLFGIYPQNIVSDELHEILESKYLDKSLIKTFNKFTINNGIDKFIPKKLDVYEYEGNRYIRFSTNNLSNDANTNLGDNVWIMVSPIKWIIDEKENIAVSDKVLFGGVAYKYNSSDKHKKKNNSQNVQFNFKKYKGADEFDNYTIFKFMNNYFGNEIFQAYNPIKRINNDKISTVCNNNNNSYYGDTLVRRLIKK